MSECIFCQIVSGKAKAEIVYQGNSIVAFKDLRPRAPVHLLLVPQRHIETLLDLESGDRGVVGDIFHVAARLAGEHGIAKDGFRVVVNCGPAAGQTVYHLHFHLLGGRSFTWPPG
jgi:histidine triad (HIT) family protein